MKPSQIKSKKPVLNTPTLKQSPLKYSSSQNYLRQLKQSSRYNSKQITAKSDQNLNSPAHLLQKTGFTSQTPSRSSGKVIYAKNKNVNPIKTESIQQGPNSAKSQLEKFAFEKSLEIDVYATNGNLSNTTRGSSSTTNQSNQKLSSLTAREHSLDSQQQKILENFAKKSPTSSSQTQAKLLVVLQKDSNNQKNVLQAKPQQYNSPKVGIKNAILTSSNKENVNTLNSPTSYNFEAKSENKKSARRFLNTSANDNSNNVVNESSDTLRLEHPGLGSVEKEGGDRCANHPHKKAKYYVIPEGSQEESQEHHENPENRYCSKCAIKFVESGLKIQELLSSPQELRKSEVEEFLIRLSDARRSTTMILDSIVKKRNDIGIFYSKQIEKAELIVSAFLKILNEEKARASEEFTLNQEQTFEEIEDIQKQVEDRLNSMTSIHHDIEKNLNNILNNIEIKPFKAIMSKYNEKLDEYLAYIDSQVRNHQISVSKLPGFKQKILEDMRPTLVTLFNKIDVLTSLIKREATQSLSVSKNKRASQEDGLRDNLNKSSLYISFENKEIFEDAVNSSQDPSIKKDQQSQNQGVRRCSDLYSYTYGQKVPQVQTESGSLPKSNEAGRSYNTISHEPKGIVKKTDIHLESYMDNRTVKTPQIVRNQQNASNTAHTKRPMSYQISSEERFLSNPSTSEFYGHQMSLQQSSFDANDNSQDIPSTRYSNIGGNTSLQIHNRHESCPSPQIGASSTQEATDSVFDTGFASQSNRSTKKYINILEKISTNQSRKNAVYSDMLKSNTLTSPRYTTTEEDYNEIDKYSTNYRLENGLNEQRSPDNIGRPPERMAPDSGLSSRPDIRTDNNPQKELKNYPPFFHFIESKINNEKAQQSNSNYQKTLFCCSPNFKENIESTEEDS